MKRLQLSMAISGMKVPPQRMVVLPRPVLLRSAQHGLLGGLHVTDVGVFANATGHHCRRDTGCRQLVLVAVQRGAGWCRSGGMRQRLGAGDVLALPIGTPHEYAADQDDPWTIFWIHIAGSLVGGWLKQLGIQAAPTVLRGIDIPAFSAQIEAATAALHDDTEPSQLRAAAAASAALAVLAERRGRGGTADPIDLAVAAMHGRIDGQVTVGELAELAGLSPSHFSARFRRVTGRPVLDYFLRLKMRRAAELLDTSSLSVTEIALRLGYEDPFYFSRRFSGVHGMPPSAYRCLPKG